MAIKVGDRVRFSASLSNGGTATWIATVVSVRNDGTCAVRPRGLPSIRPRAQIIFVVRSFFA